MCAEPLLLIRCSWPYICQNIFMEVYGVLNFIVIKKLQAIKEANSAVGPKHASADTTQKWISVPRDKVDNAVVVLRSYANLYSLHPPATHHGHQMQHLFSYLHQCGKNIDDFLRSLHTSEGNLQLPAPPHHKEQP